MTPPDTAPSMSPVVRILLTQPLPCAVLACVMFMAPAWGSQLGSQLGGLLSLILLLPHLLLPALFALVSLGGGLPFALKIAAISSALVFALSSFSIQAGLIFASMYAITPMYAALRLRQERGLETAILSVVGLWSLLLSIALWVASGEASMQTYMEQMIAPVFQGISAPTASVAEFEAGKKALAALLPASTVLLFASIWVADLLKARQWADYYQAFQAPVRSWRSIQFGTRLMYVFFACVITASATSGNIGFFSSNAAIILAGLIALQGLAVAQTWLHSQGKTIMSIVLVLLLFFQPFVIGPILVLLGGLDCWIDFRRRFSADGGY